MQELITNTWKIMIKIVKTYYLKYWDVNNFYVWVMSHKLPWGNFQWVEEISELNEDFIKSYNDDSNEGYFLEVDVLYPAK